MNAELIFKERINHQGGYIQEMVIWKLPQPVKGSQHCYKYRLFFGVSGERLIGYDNERPKGDHRHYQTVEKPYHFIDVSTLVQDFLQDIQIYFDNYQEDEK